MQNTVLILGARGRFGLATARAFSDAGWRVVGQVRIAMEARLRASGVRAVVIRAGDFFGSGKGPWFDTAMVKDIRKGVFTYPGTPGVSRAWAYLPDLARTFVAVAQRRNALMPYEVFHFAGHQITAQRWTEVLTAVARTQGWVKPDGQLKLKAMPWALIRLGAMLVPTWSALLEMRYLWEMPHALANAKLTALIGPEPHTPLAQAAEAALVDLELMGASRLSTVARGPIADFVVQ
jgi:nucleoside-diphosphate-sugar epimerase